MTASNTATTRLPVLFVGHGSPMNALEDNAFTQSWRQIAAEIPRPRAILAVSAHWYLSDQRVTAQAWPRTIHDFYGFPQALFDVQYPAPGALELAAETARAFSPPLGLDHGTWSVLRVMYPAADIPVYQLSLDTRLSGPEHLKMSPQLQALREQGVLILGSGNIVHNLRLIQWGLAGGHDWAEAFQAQSQTLIRERQDQRLARFEELGTAAQLAIPSPDHFLPLLYVLGDSEADEPQHWFNTACVMGSLSMDSVLIG
ncbi:MAG: 4,5-DOPA dioxygenase extradiol [Candidatus Sericytochromatia bacterium]|nr:4,5-DOPA dioxygenase extradiol [Candidatus Sericytochromatia bacterium]